MGKGRHDGYLDGPYPQGWSARLGTSYVSAPHSGPGPPRRNIVGYPPLSELDDAQLRPVLHRLQDRGLPLRIVTG
jgi:hypothetical protein